MPCRPAPAMALLPQHHAASLYPPPHPPPHRFKDAVKECSNALAQAPNSTKALRHRARAYEQQALFKQALGDIQVGASTGGWGRHGGAQGGDESAPITIALLGWQLCCQLARRLPNFISSLARGAACANLPGGQRPAWQSTAATHLGQQYIRGSSTRRAASSAMQPARLCTPKQACLACSAWPLQRQADEGCKQSCIVTAGVGCIPHGRTPAPTTILSHGINPTMQLTPNPTMQLKPNLTMQPPQAVNRTDAASDESREAEKRLKDVLAGRRPSLANGAASRAAAAPSASRPARCVHNGGVGRGSGGERQILESTGGRECGEPPGGPAWISRVAQPSLLGMSPHTSTPRTAPRPSLLQRPPQQQPALLLHCQVHAGQ